jgi:hypothetical protein
MRRWLQVGLVVWCACFQPVAEQQLGSATGGGIGSGGGAGSVGGGGGSSPPDATGGGLGAGGGLATDGGSAAAFQLVTLDATAQGELGLAMAVEPLTERVAVVYFTDAGTQTHSGVADYAIRYLELQDGGLTVGPETIRTVQRLEGLALVFDPTNGEPLVAYLGGATDPTHPSLSAWYQHQPAISRRHAGSWTETTYASTTADIPCSDPAPDVGWLVGLWPALGFDSSNNLYFAFRDCYWGESSLNRGWLFSDVKMVSGAIDASTTKPCVTLGNVIGGSGGHLRMAKGAEGLPVVVYDDMPIGPDFGGSDIHFAQRNPDGSWLGQSLYVEDTHTGGSLAWDVAEGYGIAVFDAWRDQLSYSHIASLYSAWSAADLVYAAGKGGWYPSLAMDPIHHQPTIAFYICGTAGFTSTNCQTGANPLMVTQRVAGGWQSVVVDPNGGYLPQLAFFASGKRVIAYRQPASVKWIPGMRWPAVTAGGPVRLAVER